MQGAVQGTEASVEEAAECISRWSELYLSRHWMDMGPETSSGFVTQQKGQKWFDLFFFALRIYLFYQKIASGDQTWSD